MNNRESGQKSGEICAQCGAALTRAGYCPQCEAIVGGVWPLPPVGTQSKMTGPPPTKPQKTMTGGAAGDRILGCASYSVFAIGPVILTPIGLFIWLAALVIGPVLYFMHNRDLPYLAEGIGIGIILALLMPFGLMAACDAGWL
jgi:hypothetical protein